MTAQPDLKTVGRRIPLADGLEKVTGQARYSADSALPGMLHARLVLSPYAHARILSIDKAPALEIPGVVAVLTAGDLPTRGRLPTNRNSATLAKDRVVFRGQPVVIVVGETEGAAADGADTVFVDYEELPAIIDPELALEPDAPLVWPNGVPKDEVNLAEIHAGAVADDEKPTSHGNLSGTVNFDRGDIGEGFAQSDVIIERTYRIGIVHQAYLEPHAAVASWDAIRGELTIWTATQGQFGVRDESARLLKLPKSKVTVIPTKVGGGFGAKYGIIEPLVAATSVALGKPVRLVLTRSEDFLTTTPSPATVIHLKTGAKRDGSLTALQARVLVDTGAFPFGLAGIVCTLLAGYYRFPNLEVRGFEVLTHKPQVGAYRAPGAPQATFAIESNMGDMADELGLDPLEFRRQNAIQTGDPMPDGRPWPSVGLRECIDRIADHPLWQNRGAADANGGSKKRGVGLAIGGWPGGTSPASAVCRVDSDGTINVHIGSVDVSGSNTSMVALAAEVLGVSPDAVRIISGGTDTVPYAPPSGGSQITYTVGAAVLKAAEDVKEQILAVASDMFEADPQDLELADGYVSVRGVPNKRQSIADIAERTWRGGSKFPPIVGNGGSAISMQAPGFTAQLAEIEVDTNTGEISVLTNVVVQDVGRAINPLMVEGQVHGGATQGLGYGLWEELVYDETGQLITASFMDYVMPRTSTVPHYEVIIVENPSPNGPFGARGVGEPSIVAGAAAVGNAVKAATGVRVCDLPLKPERLWSSLHPVAAE
ncbi:MAG: xanthine dehydrogenase family protein molybdopterin-binding subunit [Anaerolineae bacterium]